MGDLESVELMTGKLSKLFLYVTRTSESIVSLQEEFENMPEIPENEFLKGDMNKNQIIDLEDAQIVLKMALKIVESQESDILMADVDEDIDVTLSDAQKVLRAALKIEIL